MAIHNYLVLWQAVVHRVVPAVVVAVAVAEAWLLVANRTFQQSPPMALVWLPLVAAEAENYMAKTGDRVELHVA